PLEKGAALRRGSHFHSRRFGRFIYSGFIFSCLWTVARCEIRLSASWLRNPYNALFALSQEDCPARRFHSFQLLQLSNSRWRVDIRDSAVAVVSGIFHVFFP